MKSIAFITLLSAFVSLTACDSQREEAAEENNDNRDVNVKVEDRRPAQVERDTVFVGVEKEEEEPNGVEIKVEESGDFEIKKKGN